MSGRGTRKSTRIVKPTENVAKFLEEMRSKKASSKQMNAARLAAQTRSIAKKIEKLGIDLSAKHGFNFTRKRNTSKKNNKSYNGPIIRPATFNLEKAKQVKKIQNELNSISEALASKVRIR